MDATAWRERRDNVTNWLKFIKVNGSKKTSTGAHRSYPLALPAETTTMSDRPHLLALPPELRTMIFEYVLIETERIKVRPSLRPPALLSTCRQVREEVGLIWWEQNTFQITIWDCNASVFVAFAKLHYKQQRRYNTIGHLVYQMVLRGSKGWNSHLTWCYEVWANTIPSYRMLEPSDEFEAFVSVLSTIARWHRGRPWEECFNHINASRYAVAKFAGAWSQRDNVDIDNADQEWIQ